MVKLWIGALLALTAVNSMAGNMYVYKDKGGRVLITKTTPSGELDKFTKKVKVNYYKDSESWATKDNRDKAERAKYLADDGSVTYTKKVKVTNSSGVYSTVTYVGNKEELNQAIEKLRAKTNEHYKSESHTDSNDYADSAYAGLR